MVQLWRAFGDIVPIFIFIILLVCIANFFLIRKGKLDFNNGIINILFFISVIGILLVTLYPKLYGVPVQRVVNLIPFSGMYNMLFHSVDIGVPIRNIGLNILLFVPFGFLFSLRRSLFRKVRRVNIIISGLFLSLIIEALQYMFPLGRSADIDDLILNTFGTLLGYLLWKLSFSKLNILLNTPNKLTESQ